LKPGTRARKPRLVATLVAGAERDLVEFDQIEVICAVIGIPCLSLSMWNIERNSEEGA
jgi:hypothetical protein